jgi:hypothetical protein
VKNLFGFSGENLVEFEGNPFCLVLHGPLRESIFSRKRRYKLSFTESIGSFFQFWSIASLNASFFLPLIELF